jgi:hypothetical protein
MDSLVITKNATDMNPLLVDVTRLGREDRKILLQRCADVLNGCSMTIHGIVEKKLTGNELVAEKLEW